MRQFLLYLFVPLTTTIVVATPSLASLLDARSDGGDGLIYFPSTTANSNGLLLDDSAFTSRPDTKSIIPGWAGEVTSIGEGNEQLQANNDNCATGPNSKRKRRREEGSYCSPSAAPLTPPHSQQQQQQEEGVESSTEQRKTGGSTTGTTTGQPGLRLGTDRLEMLRPVPWSTTQSSCPGNRPVAICAGADFQPWEIDQGWQQIPFSDSTLTEMFYWPYCRLCTLHFTMFRPIIITIFI